MQVQPFVNKLRSWITRRKVELGLLPASALPSKSNAAKNQKKGNQPQQQQMQYATAIGQSPAPSVHSSFVMELAELAGVLPAASCGPALTGMSSVGSNNVVGFEPPNLVLSSKFRFDRDAILSQLW